MADGKLLEGRQLVVAKLTIVTGELRDQTVDRLKAISNVARDTEEGTTKYAIFFPREDDGKTIWVIEEYVDKPAFQSHMESDFVKGINEWFQQQPAPIFPDSDPPVLHMLQYIDASFSFTRPEVDTAKDDQHVLFAELDYTPGGVETATPYWRAVVHTGRDREVGTLAYGVARSLQAEEKLATFEVYESEEYLRDVHVPSDAISESIKNTKHLRTGLRHHALKKVYGFLYKDTR